MITHLPDLVALLAAVGITLCPLIIFKITWGKGAEEHLAVKWSPRMRNGYEASKERHWQTNNKAEDERPMRHLARCHSQAKQAKEKLSLIKSWENKIKKQRNKKITNKQKGRPKQSRQPNALTDTLKDRQSERWDEIGVLGGDGRLERSRELEKKRLREAVWYSYWDCTVQQMTGQKAFGRPFVIRGAHAREHLQGPQPSSPPTHHPPVADRFRRRARRSLGGWSEHQFPINPEISHLAARRLPPSPCQPRGATGPGGQRRWNPITW